MALNNEAYEGEPVFRIAVSYLVIGHNFSIDV